jgi:hypothetical protein
MGPPVEMDRFQAIAESKKLPVVRKQFSVPGSQFSVAKKIVEGKSEATIHGESSQFSVCSEN